MLSFVIYLANKTLFLTYITDTAGAKEAHAVTPHFAQILYFSLVSVLAQAPMHFTFTHAVDLFQSFWRSRPLSYIQMFLALIAGIFSVHFFRLHQTLITCLTSKQNLHFDFSIMKCIFWWIQYDFSLLQENLKLVFPKAFCRIFFNFNLIQFVCPTILSIDFISSEKNFMHVAWIICLDWWWNWQNCGATVILLKLQNATFAKNHGCSLWFRKCHRQS